jgi:hypothetical protein
VRSARGALDDELDQLDGDLTLARGSGSTTWGLGPIADSKESSRIKWTKRVGSNEASQGNWAWPSILLGHAQCWPSGTLGRAEGARAHRAHGLSGPRPLHRSVAGPRCRPEGRSAEGSSRPSRAGGLRAGAACQRPSGCGVRLCRAEVPSWHLSQIGSCQLSFLFDVLAP